jgi:hypothetical protein
MEIMGSLTYTQQRLAAEAIFHSGLNQSIRLEGVSVI